MQLTQITNESIEEYTNHKSNRQARNAEVVNQYMYDTIISNNTAFPDFKYVYDTNSQFKGIDFTYTHNYNNNTYHIKGDCKCAYVPPEGLNIFSFELNSKTKKAIENKTNERTDGYFLKEDSETNAYAIQFTYTYNKDSKQDWTLDDIKHVEVLFVSKTSLKEYLKAYDINENTLREYVNSFLKGEKHYVKVSDDCWVWWNHKQDEDSINLCFKKDILKKLSYANYFDGVKLK